MNNATLVEPKGSNSKLVQGTSLYSFSENPTKTMNSKRNWPLQMPRQNLKRGEITTSMGQQVKLKGCLPP